MEQHILDFLSKNGGATAKVIAATVGCTTTQANRVLYQMKREGRAVISTSFKWTLIVKAAVGPKKAAPSAAPATTAAPVPTAQFPSPEQEKVITAPPETRIAVEAGPGTGKTESLAARIRHLIGPGKLSVSNILVLSFSVAAVKELKARVQKNSPGAGAAAAWVEIRTFDSFASRLLRTVNGAASLSGLDFEARILRATKEIAGNPEARKRLAPIRHVLLDEMQDLVGARADFAHALLAALKPAFTIFGDSAQGIYDFQIRKGPSRTTSGDLMRKIRATFADLGPSLAFTANFRVGANTLLQDISLTGRALLLKSPDEAREFLEKKFTELGGSGSTGKPVIEDGFLGPGSCVVCRTNGQVLRLAGQLHEKKIPFRIARDRNQYTPPAWVGAVFRGWDDERVKKPAFIAKACQILKVPEAEGIRLWQGMIAAFGSEGTVAFDIGELRNALTEGAVLPDLALVPEATDAIELSTIHRSKGREFTNVIVVMDPDGTRADDEDGRDDPSEPRILFVALTRAKSGLRRMEAATKGIWMPKERWIRSFGPQDGFKKLNCFQVGLAGDLDGGSFAAGTETKAAATQAFLLEKCRPGAPVELILAGREQNRPIYRIKVGGREVGCTSIRLGRAVWSTLNDLNGEPKAFPKTIRELWIRDVITVVGDLSDERIDRSLRTSGLWLGLELEGLGYCDWFK